MLPHPSMAFAWEEDVVRPTRVLVAVFVLSLVLLVGTSGLIAFARHDTPTTVAGQLATHPPSHATGR